ncbi:23S rRNA (guanosine(2251)-2'-O)-methyltransferase RlmB [Rhizosphaericola mali]|nr:23S rRNA (guanosine(2251)-2'-O)-methyltransferase RlmB [Rhizosphaericola mali]
MPFQKKKSPSYLPKKNMVVGRNPLVEALTTGANIDKILVARKASGEAIDQVRTLAREKNIPIQYVPNEKLNGLTNINHQGIIAFKSAVIYQDLQQVIDWVLSKGETPLFLMLDGVTDVRNIGAMSRSALCCGAQAIIIPDKGVGALNEDAVKSSAGALEQIQVCRVDSLLKALDTLHLNGIKVYTSEMNAKSKVYELPLSEPSCIIMGNEEKGVQSYLTKAADDKFTIPMKGDFDSFNVSVAAGIILYEAMKQRLLTYE